MSGVYLRHSLTSQRRTFHSQPIRSKLLLFRSTNSLLWCTTRDGLFIIIFDLIFMGPPHALYTQGFGFVSGQTFPRIHYTNMNVLLHIFSVWEHSPCNPGARHLMCLWGGNPLLLQTSKHATRYVLFSAESIIPEHTMSILHCKQGLT